MFQGFSWTRNPRHNHYFCASFTSVIFIWLKGMGRFWNLGEFCRILPEKQEMEHPIQTGLGKIKTVTAPAPE